MKTFFPSVKIPVDNISGSYNLSINRLTGVDNNRGGFEVFSTTEKWGGKWLIHKGGLDWPWTRLASDSSQEISQKPEDLNRDFSYFTSQERELCVWLKPIACSTKPINVLKRLHNLESQHIKW